MPITASNNPFECTPAIIGSGQPNALLFLGPITRNGNNFSIPPLNASARIAGIIRSNVNAFNYTIAPETTLNRIDWIIYTPAGLQHLVGEAFSTIVTSPTIPDPENSVLVKEYKITGTNVSEGTNPVIGNPYILKNQFNQIAASADKKFYLQQQSNYLIIDPDITEIKGIYLTENGEAESYTGKFGFFSNFLNVAVPMRHLNAEAPVKFKFPKTNGDYLIQPGETLYFIEESYNVADSNLWKCLNEKVTSVVNPAALLSANANNAAVLGSDAKIFVPQMTVSPSSLISGNANNAATTGTDGKIFVPASASADYTQPQTISGLFTFLDGKFGLRNVANTFTSFFKNTNTASRTYTLQNRDGTLADMTDVAGKMNVPSGTTNFLSKFLSATTIGSSSIVEEGTFIGIGTSNSPTKDMTLGNQANRTIGIEMSDSSTKGRDLTIEAGLAINYNLNSNFNQFQNIVTNRLWGSCSDFDGNIFCNNFGTGLLKLENGGTTFAYVAASALNLYVIAICATPSGDMYAVQQGPQGYLFKKPAGGIWSDTGQQIGTTHSLVASNNGNVYASTSVGIKVMLSGSSTWTILQTTVATGGTRCYNGDVLFVALGTIWKQTNGSGVFVNTNVAVQGNFITSAPNGNVYSCVSNGNIFMQTAGSGAFITLNQTVRNYNGIVAHPNGNVFAFVDSGGFIYMQSNQGTGLPNLDGGTLKAKAGAGKGSGKSRFEIYTGQKTAIGTDMQAETLREYIDENGHHIYMSIPVFSDNSAAIAGGLPIGCEYRTATGVKMIVY